MSASVPSWFGFSLRTMRCWRGVAAIVAQLAVQQLLEEMSDTPLLSFPPPPCQSLVLPPL